MMAQKTMKKVYNPKTVEERWYRYWEENLLFHAKPNRDKKPYTIVIPPPNITGILTMGHVLNNTLQDVLIRRRRMQEFETLWMPGTDHASIATQNVVEKELAKEGKTRYDLGREKFLEIVWKWNEKYGGAIIRQLKGLGCSCDWARERFTMDEDHYRSVLEAFVRLYERGFIYKGEYIINWCSRCHTALSDEESIHQEENGHLWSIKYPVKGEDERFVTVATTRPETMLGDTAVAVNPKDERYKDLVGKTLILPAVGRELPVVADDFVDPEFGTGAVKVTPAHDPNDFDIGRRHNLPQVLVMNKDGTMNENAGERYSGMDRFECRKSLVEDLKRGGLIAKIENHVHSIGHCQRCDTTVEPYLSEQWFVKMDELAKPAIQAVREGKLKIYHQRWTKVYLDWLSNIRDWCISRQLWWGHRVPVWYCDGCDEFVVSIPEPEKCSKCGNGTFRQDEDVLDTWFSSWLWPFSTLGWPEETPELDYFYPTDTLVTGPDIIFFWVARMVMAGYEFRGECPFNEVYFTGLIKDEKGRKMSKSLGNSPDPSDLIAEYGADALRFTVTLLEAQGQDIFFSNDKVEIGRNFTNKIWNAARFVTMNLEDFDAESAPTDLSELSDRWILSRLNRTIKEVNASLERFRFNEASQTLYDFIWHDYCDWYVELSKPRLYNSDDADTRTSAQRILARVLETSMRLLHPFMPFITEEIWQMLPQGIRGDCKTVMISEWPEPDDELIDEDAERKMRKIQGVTMSARNIRAEMNVPPSSKVEVGLVPDSQDSRSILESNKSYIASLTAAQHVFFLEDGATIPAASATGVSEGTVIFVPLGGLIDLDVERVRLEKEINRFTSLLQGSQKKLENNSFVEKAPKEVVERERAKRDEYRTSIEKLTKNIEALTP